MLKFNVVALSGLLLLAASPASAKDDGTTSKSAEDKKSCRSVSQLGTRIPTRVCRTEGEWTAIERQNEELMRESRMNKASTCRDNGAC